MFDEGSGCPGAAAGLTSASAGVAEPYRRRGVATWLLGQAAGWLRLARVSRLLDYASPDEPDTGYRAFLATAGFQELTRTRRGWTRAPRPAP